MRNSLEKHTTSKEKTRSFKQEKEKKVKIRNGIGTS